MMLAAALEAELDEFAHEHEVGHRLVVRNGHARPREVRTVGGAVEIHSARR
jgi:hypothetical protein